MEFSEIRSLPVNNKTGNARVGLDSPFALLSPVLGLKIPFEKGFFENPFSPSLNTTFCPVLGYMALLLDHQSVLCMFFIRVLSKSHRQLILGEIFGATRQFFHYWFLLTTFSKYF